MTSTSGKFKFVIFYHDSLGASVAQPVNRWTGDLEICSSRLVGTLRLRVLFLLV